MLTQELDLSPDGVLIVDVSGRWLSFNRRFVEIWQIPEAVVATRSDPLALDAVAADVADPAAFLRRVDYLYAHAEERSHELLALADGRTLERRSAPLLLATGRIQGRIWMFRDITESLRVQEQASRLAAIVEASQDAIYSVDLEGVVTTWNPGAERLLGYRAEDIIGRPIAMTLPKGAEPDIEDRPVDVGGLAAGGAAPWAYETTRRRADGRLIEVSVMLSPIRSPQGIVTARAAVARDIGDRRRTERGVQRVTRALGMLSQANVALVGAVSEARLYSSMCEAIVGVGGFAQAWITLTQNDGAPRVAAQAGRHAGLIGEVGADGLDGAGLWDGPEAPISRVRRAAEGPAASWPSAAAARGFTCAIAVPLGDRERAFGVLHIWDADPEAFSPQEVALLEELATNIDFGVLILRERLSRDRLAAIVESSRDAIIGTDLDGVITSWNHGAAAMYGYQPAEVIGRTLRLITPEDRTQEVKSILQEIGRGATLDLLETERLHKDGRRIAVALHVCPTLDLSGTVIGVSGISRDITEQKRLERDLMRAARDDSLTGLPNRGALVEALGHAIAESRRDHRAFAVLFVDLDHFKDINDTLGHPVGDRLLRQVAQRLLLTVREADIVSRFGGDEFAIICRDLAEPTDAAFLAERVLEAMGEPFFIGEAEVRSGVSVGIAMCDGNVRDADTLLSQADIALYRAKSEGRGLFRFFTETMDREVRGRVALGAELRTALRKGQLFLLYQPQVEARTGAVMGLEALLRWRHPRRGEVAPGEFITVAEQIGLAVPLGQWVMREACRQVRAWVDEGLEPPPVAINISGLHFRQVGELERDLDAALGGQALTPGRISLELTETVLMDASAGNGETLVRLRQAGFGLAIDDFGTGYSSLDYLRRFRVDRIKIDRNFVRDLDDGPGDAAIIMATIGLGHALGLKVMAEGVETARQREALQAWDCDEMQGYLFARPLAAERVAALLRSGSTLPA